jgi:pterin-4a-carbinolamine dehydratase
MGDEPRVLSDSEVRQHLADQLPDWDLAGGAIHRELRTDGWASALMLLNAIAWLSETAWHHPDLQLGWGRVGVSLRTHDAGGISERDLALAAEIDRLALWRPGAGSPLPGAPRRPGGPAAS